MIRKITSLLLLLVLTQWAVAQVPDGYYNPAKSQKGQHLKTALFQIVNTHVVRSYDNLWEDYRKTDCRADGKVWDMYSNATNYTFGGREQGANFHQEGDSYNREHSFPKSWFGGKVKPMYTDLFHLYPTDGYINNRRSSYPYGETEGENYCSANDWSKVGACTVPGYSGTVFEPNDEYKGDLARTYFYMATCYEDQIAGWNSPMLSHDAYTAYAPWALKMLLRWAKEDPVSQKEIDRNNAVYKIQKNRNPYIDYPGLEQYVWGDKTSTAFDPDHYDPNTGGDVTPEPAPDDKQVAAPRFSLPSGAVAQGTEITISCTTEGASIYYTVNGGALEVAQSPANYIVNENVEIMAYAMLNENSSDTVTVAYWLDNVSDWENGMFVKVTDGEDLTTNSNYLIVCETKNVAMGSYLKGKKDVREGVAVTIDHASVTVNTATTPRPYVFTLTGTPGGYKFYDTVNQGYLGLTKDENKLLTLNTDDDGVKWTIAFGEKGCDIQNVKYGNRLIKYNASSPRFATYNSAQQPVALYKEVLLDALDTLEVGASKVDVYTIDGRLLFRQAERTEVLKKLPRGFYIIGKMKVLVK